MSRVEPRRNVYVGHRYVPKIFGEWDQQNEYEGLSIVTHQGASYTSKKRVPVGVNILNEEYWVVTGNYNAQIEYYRDDVRNIQTEFEEVKTDLQTDLTDHKADIQTDLADHRADIQTDLVAYKSDVKNDFDMYKDEVISKVDKNTERVKTFVNADEFDSLQDAVIFCEENNIELVLPQKTYNLTETLRIRKRIKITGAHHGTELNFTHMGVGDALEITSDEGVIQGLNISGVTLRGTVNQRGLVSLGEILTPLERSVFKDMSVIGFDIGLKWTFGWGNNFDNVTFERCNKPLELGSQVNNIEFNRCSFSGFSRSSTFRNCEGINFTSGNIGYTMNDDKVTLFELFQSSVSMINPYYENFKGALVAVGNVNEILKSTFTTIGGKGTERDLIIKIGANGSGVIAENINPETTYTLDSSLEGQTPYFYLTDVRTTNSRVKPYKVLTSYNWSSPLSYIRSFGGTETETKMFKGFRQVTGQLDNSGFQLGNVTAGEDYVFSYSMRKNGENTAKIQIGTLLSSYISIPTGDFEERYIPFRASESGVFRLMFDLDQTIDIKHFAIVKGSVFDYQNSENIIKNPTAPVNGDWLNGDIVYNSNFSTGSDIGWVCTESGSPGQWASMGILGG